MFVFRGAFVEVTPGAMLVDIDYDTGDASYVRVAIGDEKPRGAPAVTGSGWT